MSDSTVDAYTQYCHDLQQYVSGEQPLRQNVDRQALVTDNLRLVFPIARRYAAASQVPLLDLIQEGNLGLIRAAQDYDPTTYAFSTYATIWIKNMIRRALGRQSHLLTISEYKIQLVLRLRRKQRLNPDLSLEQLAQEMEVSPDAVLELLHLSQDVLSLDIALADDEDTTFADILEAPAEEYNPEQVIVGKDVHASIEHLLSLLSRDERTIIILRYGLHGEEAPGTLMAIAHRLHITIEQVGVIEKRAMMKLQRYASMLHLREDIA